MILKYYVHNLWLQEEMPLGSTTQCTNMKHSVYQKFPLGFPHVGAEVAHDDVVCATRTVLLVTNKVEGGCEDKFKVDNRKKWQKYSTYALNTALYKIVCFIHFLS